MRVDQYGCPVFNEQDIMNLYMTNSDRTMKHCYVDSEIKNNLEIENFPVLIKYIDSSLTEEQYDKLSQNNWKMPEAYKNLDIAEWVLNQCTTDEQRQRVGEELLMYLDRDLFSLLQYLKYLVDTMRLHNIVWGVGRGSSVASYVLYLIGVHKIDSLYYSLAIEEFLK